MDCRLVVLWFTVMGGIGLLGGMGFKIVVLACMV